MPCGALAKFLEEDPFVMYSGDNLLQSGVQPFCARFESEHPAAVVGATPVNHPESYGVVEVSDGRILSLEEKPRHPKSDLALIGVYLFGPDIHSVVENLAPSKRGELEITEAIWKLCAAHKQVSVLRVEGWWKDTGRPSDLLEANELVLGSIPVEALRVKGRIAPGAIVEGAVEIGGLFHRGRAHVTGPSIIRTDVLVGPGANWVVLGDRQQSFANTNARSALNRSGRSATGRRIYCEQPDRPKCRNRLSPRVSYRHHADRRRFIEN